MRETRSRSTTSTQVFGTLLINSSNDLTNIVQNESSLARGASLRSVNLTNDSTNATQVEPNSDDTDYEIPAEQRESNRAQFARKKKKEKAWDYFEKIDSSTYRCKLCQSENVIIFLILNLMHNQTF